MIEGGYLKNMAAISGGLEKIGNKKQFRLPPPPPLPPTKIMTGPLSTVRSHNLYKSTGSYIQLSMC